MLSKQSILKEIKVHYREATINNQKKEGEEVLHTLGQSYLEWIRGDEEKNRK